MLSIQTFSWISAFVFSLLFSAGTKAAETFFPEAGDPVLKDREALVEWAWSPKYSHQFGMPRQEDGLTDGYLWLVGIKVLRTQDGNGSVQTYQCNIAGLIDNKAPILWPPGERYVIHQGNSRQGELSGENPVRSIEQKIFIPAQAGWHKKPRNKRQYNYPSGGITTPYLVFHRHYTPHLAYFELEGSCDRFNRPESFRNELRFPTRIDGKNDGDPKEEAVFEPTALKFTLPDALMQKIFPYTLKAADWSWCLRRRGSGHKEQINIFDQERLKRMGYPNCAASTAMKKTQKTQ